MQDELHAAWQQWDGGDTRPRRRWWMCSTGAAICGIFCATFRMCWSRGRSIALNGTHFIGPGEHGRRKSRRDRSWNHELAGGVHGGGPSLAQPDAPGKGVFVIPGEDGFNLVPSVVALDEDGRMVVGNAAREALLTLAGARGVQREAADGPRRGRRAGGVEAVSVPSGRGPGAGRGAAHPAGRAHAIRLRRFRRRFCASSSATRSDFSARR